MVKRETGNSGRARCYGCFRPVSQCYCHAIPLIENRTELLIIQHSRERNHPFNTARMARRGLTNSKLICGSNEALAKMQLPVRPTAGLLFPSNNARTLVELSPDEKPKQLVIVDGTWSQARTMMRDLPQLRELPCYRLAPTQPGQYRIRLEPTDTSLSTVEAAVEALQELEPETSGLNQLLAAFDMMVQRQLDHPQVGREHYAGGPKSGRTINIPKRLLGDPDKIVVAYAEAAYRNPFRRFRYEDAPRPPLYWLAKRLGTGEVFSRALRPDVPMTDSFLGHLELPASHFFHGISTNDFHNDWNSFVNADDTLTVYNQGTIRLLENVKSSVVNSVTLKSINFDPQRKNLTLSQFVEMKGLKCESASPEHGRAGKRLANAIALVNYLRSL